MKGEGIEPGKDEKENYNLGWKRRKENSCLQKAQQATFCNHKPMYTYPVENSIEFNGFYSQVFLGFLFFGCKILQ